MSNCGISGKKQRTCRIKNATPDVLLNLIELFVTLITPSPSTFSIWSVIYSLLIISIIVMIVKKDDSYYKSAVNQIYTLFWISCILNIAWAYFGIYRFLNAPEGFKGEFSLLQNIALAGMVVLVALAVIQFYRNRLSLIPKY